MEYNPAGCPENVGTRIYSHGYSCRDMLISTGILVAAFHDEPYIDK